MPRRAVVTGAFSYTGAAVVAELLRRGYSVHTLTNREPPADAVISSSRLDFDIDHLRRNLEGADLFVNGFWIRLPHAAATFDTAVDRSALLVRAAQEAGVGRLVQITVSNAEKNRNLGYYEGKMRVERIVRESRLSHALVRPTLVVGENDVLTGNIVWLLRKFPIFFLPRGGRCRLQPILLEEFGAVVADAAEESANVEVDAAGPEVFTFSEYVRLLANANGLSRLFPPVPNPVALAALGMLGTLLDDEILTREELLGLQQEALLSHEPPRGKRSVRSWLLANAHALGTRYVNDRARHFGADARRPVTKPSPPAGA